MYYCNWNFEIKFKMPFFLKMWLQGEWSYTPSNGFKYTRFIIKATSTLTLAIFHNGSLDLQMFQSCTILKQNVFDHICTKILFGNFRFCKIMLGWHIFIDRDKKNIIKPGLLKQKYIQVANVWLNVDKLKKMIYFQLSIF